MKKIIIFLLICNFAQAQLPAVVDGGAKIVRNGLLCWYDFAQKRTYTSGSKVYSLVNAKDSMFLDAGCFWSSPVGGVLNFDGVNDQVMMFVAETSNQFSGGITLEFWFAFNTFNGGYGRILSGYDIQNSNEYFICRKNTSNSNEVQFYLNISGTLRGPLNNAVGAIGAYQHITCVYNGSTMTVRINAVNPNSTNVTGTVTSSNSWAYYLGSGGECPNGKMANFRIYNRALTATEITQNYNAELKRFQ